MNHSEKRHIISLYNGYSWPHALDDPLGGEWPGARDCPSGRFETPSARPSLATMMLALLIPDVQFYTLHIGDGGEPFTLREADGTEQMLLAYSPSVVPVTPLRAHLESYLRSLDNSRPDGFPHPGVSSKPLADERKR